MERKSIFNVCYSLVILILATTICIAFPSFVFAGKPVKIGCSVALSGYAAKTGQWLERGYKVWQNEINEKGGLLNRPVELIVYDDETDPSKAVKLFQKLITHDKVDFVFSPYSSDVCFAATTVTEKYKMPMVCNGSAPKIYQRGYKYVFGMFPHSKTIPLGALKMAKSKGYKKVAVINVDKLYAKSAGKLACDLAKEMGFNVVYKDEYPSTAQDLSAIINKVKQAKPEVVLGISYFPDGCLLRRQAVEFGLYTKILALYVCASNPEWGKTLGKAGEYVMGGTVWEEGLPGKENRAFVKRSYKVLGEKYRKRGLDYHMAQGYAQAKILEYAIDKVGSFDNKKIRDVLTTSKIKTILIGEYKVDANGYQDIKEGFKYGTLQWINNKKEVVWPDKWKTTDPVIPFPK